MLPGAENIDGKDGASADETQDYSGPKDTGVSRQLLQVLEPSHRESAVGSSRI